MRLVQVMVPAGKRDAVLKVLDSRGIDYVMSDETSGRDYTAVVSFPLPTGAVEPILDQLREEAGIDRDAYTVVIDAETVISQRFEQLDKEWDTGEEGERIAREELIARAEELAPDWLPFLLMTFTGAVVAVAGAAVFAAMLRYGNIVPLGTMEVLSISEVSERLSPGVPSLAVALGAGIAGALAISSGVSAALVGVMIAAALVPPTAVVGIGIAWGRPTAVFGSAVLVAVNFLSINFAAMTVFSIKGYQPEEWFNTKEARRETLDRLTSIGVVMLLLTAFLGSVTYASYQRATFEDEAQDAVQDIVDDRSNLELISFEVEHGTTFPFRSAERVVVTIGYPPGTDPPSLVTRVYTRVATINEGPFGLGYGEDLKIEVHYVLVEGTDGVQATETDQ